jgi:tRNA pseudouridine synthase 10
MDILKKALKVMERPVCDNCLGRQFGQLASGLTNAERGKSMRVAAAMLIDKEKLSEDDKKIDFSNFSGLAFHSLAISPPDRNPCSICGDIFLHLDDIAKQAVEKSKRLQFGTFLVGTKVPADILDKEENLWEDSGIDWAEPIKSELNREIGKRIEKNIGLKMDRKIPNIVFLVDIALGKITISINSAFIYGEYQKLVRGIPQTKWPSKKYRTSVEEIVANPFMKDMKGRGHKLHGLGREDIDARCLAWRPFVLEILEPKKRDVDLGKLSKKIDRRVKVRNLRVSSIAEVREIKESKADKTYACIVKCKDRITSQDLEKVMQIVCEIRQRTPTRVLHRRSDKLRRKKLRNVSVKYVNSKTFKMTVTTEAGLYVKELVSGDNGRTQPSVSSVLGNECLCKDLDVINIHIPK